jgi:hypothetical protein
MGKHRVGLCAGTVTETSDRSASESFRPPSFIWKLRSTFIIIGCCMILLCAALAGPGMTSIMTASKSVRNANISVQDLIADGLAILDSVDRVKRNIEPLDVSSMMNIEAVCPTFQTNLFLPVDSLKSTIMSADYEFNELKTLLQLTDIEAIRETIDTIWNATEQMDMATNIIGDHDWIVKIFALFLGGLTFFMILRTVAALSCQHKYRPMTALTEIFVLPLFVEAMIIAWVATSVIAIVSIPTAGK